MRITPSVAVALACLAAAACGKEEVPAPPKPPEPPPLNLSYAEIDPSTSYPLKTCVITGKDLATLGHPPYAIAYKGYEMQFCSKDCVRTFAQDPEGYVRKMNPRAMFDR